MIFNNFLYNGKSDTAAALGRIPGCVGSVKAFKNQRKVFGCNAFSVVFDLHTDGVHFIQNTDIDHAVLFLKVLNAVADNIVNYPLHLFRVCDDLRIRADQIGIVKTDILGFQIQAHFFHAVPEIVRHVNPVEIVRNTVIVDLGIYGQFIDQPVHIVGFIIDGFDILIHLLGRVRHTVHNAFHIALNRGNRCL